jgi:hypothetical protein
MLGRSPRILCAGLTLLSSAARAQTLASDPTVSANSDDPQAAAQPSGDATADASRAMLSGEGQETKEKKKKKKKGKHPGLTIGDAVTIDFKARLESE